MSGLCGFTLRIILSISNQKWVNTYHYTLTFILLPVITFTITRIISNNIALALGMVGALSIVRFRNPVKNPFELVLFFLLITIGISMSVRYVYGLGLTLFSSLIIFIFYLISIYFKDFFSLSFSEGKVQHILEITSKKKIIELEDNKYLIQSIYNNIDPENTEIFYRLTSPNKKDIHQIKNSNFIQNNNDITNLTTNYFY